MSRFILNLLAVDGIFLLGRLSFYIGLSRRHYKGRSPIEPDTDTVGVRLVVQSLKGLFEAFFIAAPPVDPV
jgi:hypothetical protein